jgi:cobalamin synthase
VRRTAATLSIVLGSLLILGGIATWILVSTTLAEQKIVVSEDASCLAGDEVDGPFSAYCEAMVIDKHALEATGGLRYAELGREDPKRQTAMTASFLQASLFTSVVAFGVAAMAVAVGVLFLLLGLGMRDVAGRVGDVAGRTPASG